MLLVVNTNRFDCSTCATFDNSLYLASCPVQNDKSAKLNCKLYVSIVMLIVFSDYLIIA
jgi:hypothetical protein